MKKDILIYYDLVTSLKTTQEVENLIHVIDNFMLSFFKSENVPTRETLDSINADFSQKIIEVFSKSGLDINDRGVVGDFFNTLKEILAKLKVIDLILAFQPTGKTIRKIHDFVTETIGIGYVLNIEVSEDILGGSIIIFNGKYNDFSLNKSIEEAFSTKREQIVRL
jgi:F0F1-type ATP synthase delta subunit